MRGDSTEKGIPASCWRAFPEADLDWAALTHAYGPAADLPQLFDRLCGGDPAAAERAVSDIALRVCHQGAAVEEATAPSVLVLAGIAAGSEAQLATRIVMILQTISAAVGTWTRVMREAAPERRSRYLPNVGWERDVVRTLKTAAERLRTSAGPGHREALGTALDDLRAAVLEAETRLAGAD